MIETQNIEREAYRSFNHIPPRVEEILKPPIQNSRLGWSNSHHDCIGILAGFFTLFAPPKYNISSKDHDHEK